MSYFTLGGAFVRQFRGREPPTVSTVNRSHPVYLDQRTFSGALTLTSFDPGMLIFCDPPTFRAQAGRPSASWRQAHPNVALGDRAWPRVIVPCKDWPSATAYGGCGLDKGLSPGPRLPPRDRWRRPFARANGGSANLSTPGSIPMSVEAKPRNLKNPRPRPRQRFRPALS